MLKEKQLDFWIVNDEVKIPIGTCEASSPMSIFLQDQYTNSLTKETLDEIKEFIDNDRKILDTIIKGCNDRYRTVRDLKIPNDCKDLYLDIYISELSTYELMKAIYDQDYYMCKFLWRVLDSLEECCENYKLMFVFNPMQKKGD